MVKSGSDFTDFTEINITFEIDGTEYAEIAEELEDEDYVASCEKKVYTKRIDNEDMNMLIHSEED